MSTRATAPLAAVLYVLASLVTIWHVRLLEKPAMLAPHLAVLLLPGLIVGLAAAFAEARRGAVFAVLAPPAAVLALGLVSGFWLWPVALLGLVPFIPFVARVATRHVGAIALALGTLLAAQALASWREWWSLVDVLDRLAGLGELGRDGPEFARQVSDGLGLWIDVVMPFDAEIQGGLRTLVLLAVIAWGLALGLALFVLRSAIAGIVLLFVSALVSSTIYRLEHVTIRSAILLAIAAAMLTLRSTPARGRSLSPGVAVVIVTVGGLVIAAIPGVARENFLNWRKVGAVEVPGISVGYIWDQSYAPLNRGDRKTRLLQVEGDSSSRTYLRATVLDCYNGERWLSCPATRGVIQSGSRYRDLAELWPEKIATDAASRRTVTIKNLGLGDRFLPHPIETIGVDALPKSLGIVSRASGMFRGTKPLRVGDTWAMTAVVVDPPFADLQKAGRAYPVSVSVADLGVFGSVTTPRARSLVAARQIEKDLSNVDLTGRSGLVDIYRIARRVTGGAKTPYEAAVAIESWFQTNFTYDESIGYSGGPRAPLVTFLTSGERRGYCQMFSGSMALMLRLIGIPARVAAGFTAGEWDNSKRASIITDRDAHAWVEVYFPGYGWVPFEPTPGRTLATSSSTTSQDFAGGVEAAFPSGAIPTFLGKLAGLDRPGGLAIPLGTGNRADREAAGGSGATGSKGSWRPGWRAWTAVGIAGLLLLLQLAKRRRYGLALLSRDRLRIAASTRSDVVSYLRDQRVTGAVESLTSYELSDLLQRSFHVDGRKWADAQSTARYGRPGEQRDEAARRARVEARLLRRDLRRAIRPYDRVLGFVSVRSIVR